MTDSPPSAEVARALALVWGFLEELGSGIRRGDPRARSRCHFALPLIHFVPDSRTYSVPLFPKLSEPTMRPNPRRPGDVG
jgi:hypothetical protein